MSRCVLPGGNEITIPMETVDRLLKMQSGSAALVYLYILRLRGMVEDESAIRELQISRAEYEEAMGKLAKEGLIQWKGPTLQQPLQEQESCRVEDIRREMENGAAFRMLSEEVSCSLGRVLSQDDALKLFGIYDRLGLPPEVILILITSCKDEIHRRYGENRMPTMRFIEKEAYIWERNGIMTLELAEEYLRHMDTLRDGTEQICKVLQLDSHGMTQRIRDFITGWLEMGFSAEAVEIAYERTVENTGKLAWKYLDSILRNWHEKKLHTAAEIENNDTRHPAQRETESVRPGPTSHEMDRMREVLSKI